MAEPDWSRAEVVEHGHYFSTSPYLRLKIGKIQIIRLYFATKYNILQHCSGSAAYNTLNRVTVLDITRSHQTLWRIIKSRKRHHLSGILTYKWLSCRRSETKSIPHASILSNASIKLLSIQWNYTVHQIAMLQTSANMLKTQAFSFLDLMNCNSYYRVVVQYCNIFHSRAIQIM